MKKMLYVLLVMAMFTACTDDFQEIEDNQKSEVYKFGTEGDGDPGADGPDPGN